MAPHSGTLAWKTPWTEELGRLQSSVRLFETSLSLFTFTHCRRKWQSTPVFLPGESQGRGSLVGCCLWGRTESDTTEATYSSSSSSSVSVSIPVSSSSHPPLPLLCPRVLSLYLHLYFCLGNRFICTACLDSTCMH